MKDQKKALKLYNLLKRFLRSQEDVDKWLATPHPDLGDRTPKEVIESGRIDAVINMIEGALSGDMA